MRTSPFASTDWPVGVTFAEAVVRSGVAKVSILDGAFLETGFGSRRTRLSAEQF